MNSAIALPAANFFLADVGGGLGAYMTIWLQEVVGLNAAQIGTVLTVGSIVTMACATPAGALVDRVGRPRLMLVAACALIVAGVLLLLPARDFWMVIGAQSMVAVGGALGAPSMTGLTLSIVGKKGFPKQQGTNEGAVHAGNVTSSGLIALMSKFMGFGPKAAILVLAGMATALVAVLFLVPAKDIDENRMRGREKRKRGEKRGATRGLLSDRNLILLAAAIGLFHLGNAGMLPMLGLRIKELGGQDPTSWMSVCLIVAQGCMIPVAILAGRYSDRIGRRTLLMGACALLPVRAALAAFAPNVYWLIPIEVLDGIVAATFSVSAPAAVADQTYGSGRTQTFIGVIATIQALAAGLSVGAGGWVATHLGWTASFGMMGAAALLALGLLSVVRLREDEDGPKGRPKDDEADRPEGAADADRDEKAGQPKAAAMSAAV